MLFSESNRPWEPVPRWAESFVRLGYEWPNAAIQVRRISLISMPCDSPAAGLIALGAMIRDLGSPSANDIDAHYDSLLRYAKQHLDDCRDCELERCNPEEKGCGHAKKADGWVRSAANPRERAVVSDETNFERRELAWQDGSVTWRPTVNGALRWHIDDEPPTQVRESAGILSHAAYAALVNGARILPENLRRSFSGLCFAGRASGESRSREVCGAVRFRDGDFEYGLDELLTVYGWSYSDVSRVTFFNSRTEQLDRSTASPALVVADGGDSFLRVSSATRFQRSDVIGVIHRTMERERLEALGEKMTSLRQWYVQDEDMLCGLPVIPPGVSISILRRRSD